MIAFLILCVNSVNTYIHKMSEAAIYGSPIYSPFFGAMGATAAMVFSGKCIEIYIYQLK